MARDPAEIHRFCFGARNAMAAGSHSKEGRNFKFEIALYCIIFRRCEPVRASTTVFSCSLHLIPAFLIGYKHL